MKLTDQTISRRARMKYYSDNGLKRVRDETPLFASPWIALFLVLRKEFTQPRTTR